MEQSFEVVREDLRRWREENTRCSREIIDAWTDCMQHNRHRLGDERWMLEEQVFIAALDCNRMDIANQCYASLKDKFPHSLRVAKLKGMRLEALEKFDDALAIYDRIVREDETNSSVRKRRIALLRAQHRYPDAIKELVSYLNIYMSDWEAWQELMDLYLKEGDYSKAAFCMEELLLSNNQNPLYHTRYAEIRYTMGGLENMELAKTYFGYAYKMNPKNIRALYGLLLSCQNIAASSKAVNTKKKEALRLAEFAAQELKARYDAEKKADDSTELLQALTTLTLCDSTCKLAH